MKKETKKKPTPKKKSSKGKRHSSYGASWIRFAKGLKAWANCNPPIGMQAFKALMCCASEAEKEGKRLRGIKR